MLTTGHGNETQTKTMKLSLALHALTFVSCAHLPASASMFGTLTASEGGDVAVGDTTEAVYDCKLTSLWSGSAHPTDYPEEAHYSFPVLVSHNGEYAVWTEGEEATGGVQMVAETGATANLTAEIAAAGDGVYDTQIGNVQWNTNVSGIPASHIIGLTQTIAGLKVSPSHKYISTITMLAPSPDWFTGFSKFSPIKDDMWYKSFTIESQPFDAGTDSGTTFKANNTATDPQATISELTLETQKASGIFVSPDETEVMPTAEWECTLMSTTAATSSSSVIFGGVGVPIVSGLIAATVVALFV